MRGRFGWRSTIETDRNAFDCKGELELGVFFKDGQPGVLLRKENNSVSRSRIDAATMTPSVVASEWIEEG
jgi:hypothetical protein